jgi:hypothetical protein
MENLCAFGLLREFFSADSEIINPIRAWFPLDQLSAKMIRDKITPSVHIWPN